MEKLLSVCEREDKCYEYFHTNSITNRDQLRECLKTKPLEGVRINFIEDILSDFLFKKKEDERRRQEVQSSTKRSSVFVLSDMHIPFHDKKTIDVVFDCISDCQPEHIVLLGDILDCYSISRFLKDPKRFRNIQHEIDTFYKLMRELRKEIPHTKIHYILGNHENRLSVFTKQGDAGFEGLEVLEPETLFKLDKLGIKYHKTKVIIDGFIYYHGDVVRKDSAYSAKAEFYDHQMQSGISGHTHRAGSYYHTYAKETKFWLENGCLCKLDPDYINDPDKANWQQCISVINSFDGLKQGTQILIQDHKFLYNGKIYK